MSDKNTPKRNFQTIKIFEILKIFRYRLQPLYLSVSVELREKDASCHFTRILFMKRSRLCIEMGSWQLQPSIIF